MMTSPAEHRPGRVALLIDADNLSADVIEQAIEHLLQNHGAIHFRRAYCSPQKAMELTDILRRHAIRPMVNVPTGKNSTDIALAVDAIDLALTERPDVIVIASSDSDYAPLAQRLREKGCRVLGIGQAGKTGSESPLAYDGFIDLTHRASKARLPQAKAVPPPPMPALPDGLRATPPEARPKSRLVPVPSPVPSEGGSGSRPRASAAGSAARANRGPAKSVASGPARKSIPGAATASNLPAEVAAILTAVPELRAGGWVDLNGISASLRQHELLKSRNSSPSRLLKRHVDHFELLPADRPRSVRFLGTPSAE